MLMSTTAAPVASAMRAPSAIQCGSQPGELHHMHAGALALGAQHGIAAAFDQRLARGHFRYDKAAPRRSTRRRNGASVTPDMGASATRLLTPTSPCGRWGSG